MTDNRDTFPYHFDSNACEACGGKCCRGLGGYVWIKIPELEEMAALMGMDIELFSRKYVRKIKRRLALIEYRINGEYFCCFFDRINCQCTIYDNRPEQCRTFPFWSQFKKNYQQLLDECPGVF